MSIESSRTDAAIAEGRRCTELEARLLSLGNLAEEHAALRRVATLVAREAPTDEVLRSVSREACRVLGARSSLVCRYEGEHAITVLGRWDERGTGGFPIGAVVPLVPQLALARVWATGAPARNDGYEGLPGDAARAIRALGFRSVVAAPITLGSKIWGALVVGTSAEEEMPDDAEERLGDFAELVGLALSSAQAREQLADSRVRLLESSDAERRRLERDLHDGAQQRLVGLSLTLRLAQARAATDPEEAATLIARARDELGNALGELRELARGIHPAVLSERGLGPALEALGDRAPMPVEVSVEPGARLPETVEAAVYFVAAEALTNVAKYADAPAAAVRLARRDGTVVVEVADVGVGGADPAAGTGLRGLADRVEALGGRLVVESPRGAGTRVRAELPASGRPHRAPDGRPPAYRAPARRP